MADANPAAGNQGATTGGPGELLTTGQIDNLIVGMSLAPVVEAPMGEARPVPTGPESNPRRGRIWA